MDVIRKVTVAKMLGVDQRTVTRYQEREVDPLPIAFHGQKKAANEYDPVAICKWAIRQEKAKLVVDGDGKVHDLETERARLAYHQANKTELESKRLAESLVDAEDVGKEWEKVAVAVKAKLLAVPNKYGHRALGLPDIRSANALFTEIVREILQELAADEPSTSEHTELQK